MAISRLPKGAKILFMKRGAKKNPEVSIVIPTLNEEKYLEEALESIAKQPGAPSYEIVICDGGSKDRTLEIARAYADLVVYEPKKTVGAGRNTGMLVAHGRILVGANADTYYRPDWLRNLVAPFRNKSVVASMGRVLPKDGDLIDNVFAKAILHPAAYLLSKTKTYYVDSANMAVRRDAFLKINGFDLSLVSGEDTELIKRIKTVGKVVYSPKAVAKISMRRVRKWGKIYYTYFHTTNFIKAQLTSKGHGEYEPIRE